MSKYSKLSSVVIALILVTVISFAVQNAYKRYRAAHLPALEMTAMLPQGEELPITTEGVTVLFNQAMVPLTTLDNGRARSVDLEISPRISGRFSWLGTRGFIFRSDKPLDAATTYTVTLPAGINSIEGHMTNKPVTWNFSTVTPRLLHSSSQTTLFPEQARLNFTFNLSMNTHEVEKALSIIDNASGHPLTTKHELIWSDNNHKLEVVFKETLPFGMEIKVSLPRGLHAGVGNLTSKEAFSNIYTTPEANFSLTRIFVPSLDGQLEPGSDTEVSVGDAVCYEFSQLIDKESFPKAFKQQASKPSRIPPYFYYMGYDRFYREAADGRPSWVEGYTTGCVAFFDDYSEHYAFSIDPTKIVPLYGTKSNVVAAEYKAHTRAADPRLASAITKSILSFGGAKLLPMNGTNLAAAGLSVYAIPDSANYSEDVHDTTVNRAGFWEDQKMVYYDPAVSDSLSDTNLVLPLLPDVDQIDQSRMSSVASLRVPIDAKKDELARFKFDLDKLDDGKTLAPGFYLLEFVGEPLPGMSVPKARYAIIQITPVAIAIKAEGERVLVWVTDIESGKPIPSLPLTVTAEVWDKNAIVNTTKTNADGVAVVRGEFGAANDFCVQVDDLAKKSYACQSFHRLDKDWRDTVRNGTNYFAYVYTDRPIYRPGQPVYISSFVREVREGRYFTPAAETEYTLEVTDASGNRVFEKTAIKDAAGIVSGEFTLDAGDDLPRGNYNVTVSVGEQSFTRVFVVSSYRKPTFKVDAVAEKPAIFSREALNVNLTGSYFFGAPLKNAKATWSIMTSTYQFRPEGFTEYGFVDSDLLFPRATGEDEMDCGDCEYWSADTDYDVLKSSEVDDGYDDPRGAKASAGSPSGFLKEANGNEVRASVVKLDDDGKLSITYTADLKNYPFSQVLSVEASVQDAANQEVSASEDIIVHKAAFYLGSKSDKWAYGEKDKAKIHVVSLNTDGKPVGGRKFSAAFVRRDWQSIQRRNAKGWWETIYEPKDVPISKSSGKTGADGKTDLELAIPQEGEYRVILTAKDDKDNDVRSALSFSAWGDGYAPWHIDEPQKLELVPDKDSYKIGDTAHILVKSLLPATKALLTLERGHLLEYKLIDLGGTNAGHIELPITEGHLPNLYVSVVAHVGRDKTRAPLLFSGQTELAVEPDRKRLNITLTTDKPGNDTDLPKYTPGGPVTVNVVTKDADGKPIKAHVIVSVADEAVLRLLDYQLPDLVKKYYYHRYNGVRGSSSMLSLKAGDGAKDKAKKRRIFKDTAHFEANLVTGEDGTGKVSFNLPEDLTTWVVEAVAISESKTAETFENERMNLASKTPFGQLSVGSELTLSDGTFVGSARTRFLSTLPILIRPVLPRFVAWGDTIRAAIIANNQNPEVAKGKIIVNIGGEASTPNGIKIIELPFEVAGKSETKIGFDFMAADKTEAVMVSAEAKDSGGKLIDAFEIRVPSKDRFQPEVVATSGMTQGEAKEKLDLPEGLTAEKGGLTAEFKASLGLASAGALRELIYYPYGCAEQKSASLLAMLMAREMSLKMGESTFDALAPLKKDELEGAGNFSEKMALLDGHIQAAIDSLLTDHQVWNGGMKYWPTNFEPSLFASIQSSWAMQVAARAGFSVAENPARHLRDYVATEIGRSNNIYEIDLRAFGLWVSSMDGAWNEGVASDLLAKKETLSITGLSYFVAALSAHGATREATTLAKRIGSLAQQDARSTKWRSSSFFWSSETKNTALAALALFSRDPKDPLVPRALAHLLTRKRMGETVSTQDNLALTWFTTRYALAMHEDTTDFKAAITLNGKILADAVFNRGNLLTRTVKTVPMRDIKVEKMPADLSVSRSGTGTLYYDMELKYYLPPDQTPPREEGLIVTRQFYALDDKKEEHPLHDFRVGETYKGVITLALPKDRNYLLVEEPLPAGFEPVDMTLATTSRASNLRAQDSENSEQNQSYSQYDDEVRTPDYGSDWNFVHQEIHDDAIIWSDMFIPAGIYRIRYPVRATTPGRYLSAGTTAFEFYNPEIFGRGRGSTVEVE